MSGDHKQTDQLEVIFLPIIPEPKKARDKLSGMDLIQFFLDDKSETRRTDGAHYLLNDKNSELLQTWIDLKSFLYHHPNINYIDPQFSKMSIFNISTDIQFFTFLSLIYVKNKKMNVRS